MGRNLKTLKGDIGRRHVETLEENTRRHWKDTRRKIRRRHEDAWKHGSETDWRTHGLEVACKHGSETD